MKKILTAVVAFAFALTANAQFEQGKQYVGASLSGLGINYNGAGGLNLGVDAHGGYMLYDDIMLLGQVSYSHTGGDVAPDQLKLGIGGRYYIEQNGIYLGANLKYVHANHNYNDLLPGVEVGYAFFLSGTATIEPAIYYDQSFRRHKDFSTVGFKIGFGLYF